jgi:hypothetical protein
MTSNNTQGGDIGKLTREQALAVRERCLRALKDRLIERANIIQVSGALGRLVQSCFRTLFVFINIVTL